MDIKGLGPDCGAFYKVCSRSTILSRENKAQRMISPTSRYSSWSIMQQLSIPYASLAIYFVQFRKRRYGGANAGSFCCFFNGQAGRAMICEEAVEDGL